MQPSTKYTIIFCLFYFSISAQAWIIHQGDLTNWMNSLSPAKSVSSEVEKYFTDENINAKSADIQTYIQQFIQYNHQVFRNNVIQVLQNSSKNQVKCLADTKIEFLNKTSNMKIGQNFESEALYIESMDCLGFIDHHKVFTTLLSDSFQKKAVSGLQNISSNQNNNLVCQQTSVFPIGESNYCFTQNIWQDENTYVIQSFNESNAPNASAPVYFREVFTVIKKTNSGEVFIYNLALGRGPDLPFHSIVRATVRNQQQSMIEQLIEAAK